MIEPLLTCLRSHRFTHTSEDELQRGIAEAFDASGIEYEREVRISKTDRLDFLCGGIAVEVKIKGSSAEVLRQLFRYAKDPRIERVILATTRSQHRALAGANVGKPLLVAWLGAL